MKLKQWMPHSFAVGTELAEDEIASADLELIEQIPWVTQWINHPEYDRLEVQLGVRKGFLLFVTKNGRKQGIGFIQYD